MSEKPTDWVHYQFDPVGRKIPKSFISEDKISMAKEKEKNTEKTIYLQGVVMGLIPSSEWGNYIFY